MKLSPALLLPLLAAAAPLSAQLSAVQDKFKGFDTNGDGVISGAEMEGAPYLKELDLDADGSLTLPETLKALRQGRGPAARSKGTAAGAGAVVSPGTSASAATTPTPGEDDQGRLFKRLDQNQDGVLTENELPRKEWFQRLDLDKDGKATYAEASAVVGALVRRGVSLPEVTPPGTKPATEDPALTEAPLQLKPSEVGVGRLVPDLLLKDLAGEEQSLAKRVAGGKGAVLAFFGATCPISGKLGPELARLEQDCAQMGVRMLLVCPVAVETVEDIRQYAATHGLKSPVLHDVDGRLTAALAATTTTECFLLDAARTLVYRGAVNDQYGLGYAKDKPTQNYLRSALGALSRQEKPAVAATTAPGCALDAKPAAVAATSTTVTYHNQISRIMQASCVECHRAGGVGPFALESYEDVIEHAGMIRKQVERGAMPPWFAAPAPEGTHSPWINDSSLSKQDKADLLAWLTSDRPKGNTADAPAPRKFAEEWALGTPDAVLQLPRPVAIKAEGTMPYQFLTVTTQFEEDRWVRGYEILPTDRSVVHHVIVQVHPKGSKARDRGEGAEGYWAAYVPGNASHLWPEGFAKKLPAGSTVSFQIHYTPNGKATEDQLKMGLFFAKTAPRYVVHTAAVPNPRLNIPAGAANHVEVAERPVPSDMNLMAYMAHMHVRGKAFKFEVTYPNGKQEVLLDIPRYDFNWQLRYDYAKPHFLPQGSRVKITAVFDNSPGNPANPDPNKNVRWGQQTFDEMMIGYFEYYTPNLEGVAAR